MKKALIFAGLAAAALSFVGCNKEADLAPNGRKVGIVLNNAETRTVNNGMLTNWEDGDALNVFYAAAGTTEYSENTQFTVDDAASNHATGTAELTAAAYDWYLLYPYNSHVTTPANIKNGYLTVGSASNKTQTQAGLDSKAHLAGENLPVYGVVKNVAVDKPIEVSMKHVTSVVAVNLTNGTNKPLKVDEISFTAPEDIVGTYYINFAGDELVFTGSGSGYVSSTATLAVTGDNTIAAGASAKFYLAIKPFQAKSGDKLAIKVSADAGVVEKELELQSVVEFKSGVIKPMNIDYENPSSLPTITISDIASTITGSSDSFEGKLEGATVTFVSGSNAFIQDETGGILLYQSGHTLKAGDLLSGTVRGTGKVFNGLKEMTSLTVETVTSGQPIPDPVELTLAQLNKSYDEYVSVLVKVKGVTVPAGFTNRNATMTDGDETLALRDQINGLTISAGKYDIVGYPSYYNNPQFGVWAQDNIISAGSVNIFNVAPQQIDVAATDTSAEINVTGNVDWTAEANGGATLDKASGNGEAVITVSFPANTDSDKTKEYTVFVRTKATGVNDEFEVNITQAKADPAGEKTVTVDFSKQGYENGTEMTTQTIDGIAFSFDKGDNKNAPKYYTTGEAVRMYGGNSMTVSVSGNTIVSIGLTFDSGEGTNAITTDVPTYEEPTWTGEASSVTFTIGGTSGHRRIKTVTVKYKEGSAPAAATLTSIAVTGQKTVFNVGDAFTLGDGKVTASYSDGTTKDVTSSVTHSNPDMSTAGSKEVTLSYTENSVSVEAKYQITVNDVFTPTHAGTVEDPYSVADAMAATEALGEGKTSSDSYFTKGIISEIVEVSPDHGNATYYISDDGTTGTQFKVFRGKYIGSINFSAEDQVKVGDEVVVYGKLTHYKPSDGGASEIEIAQNNYIHSLKRGGTALKAMSAVLSQAVVASAGGNVTVNVYGNVDWTASVTTPATLDPASGSGIGVITVNVPENTTDKARSFAVTVSAAGVESVVLQINQNKKEEITGKVDILNQTFTGVTGTTYTEFSGKEGVSGAVYAGQCAGANESIQLRSNNNNSGVITTASGGKVKKVIVTWNSNTASGRTLNIYGKNEAYSAATDLYDSAKQGTLLGTIVCGSSIELDVTEDVKFVGFRSASNAMYLTEVQIVWE